MMGLTPGGAVRKGGLDVCSDGGKHSDGDGEGQTDRQRQQPDLKVKGKQVLHTRQIVCVQ